MNYGFLANIIQFLGANLTRHLTRNLPRLPLIQPLHHSDVLRPFNIPLVQVLIDGHHGRRRFALLLAVFLNVGNNGLVQGVHVVHFLPAQPVKQVCQLRVVVLVFHGQLCVGVRVLQLVLKMYGISKIASTKSLVVASSVWVLPRRLLLVGVIPNPQDQHDVLAA